MSKTYSNDKYCRISEYHFNRMQKSKELVAFINENLETAKVVNSKKFKSANAKSKKEMLDIARMKPLTEF